MNDDVLARLHARQAGDVPVTGGRTLAYVYDSGLADADAVRAGRHRRRGAGRNRPHAPSASVSCTLPSSAGPRPSAARVVEHGEQVCA